MNGSSWSCMQEVVHWVPYFLSLICATIYSLGIMLEVCAKLCTQEMNTVGQCRLQGSVTLFLWCLSVLTSKAIAFAGVMV